MRRFIVAVFAIVLVLGACTGSTSPLSPDDGGRLYGVALIISANDFKTLIRPIDEATRADYLSRLEEFSPETIVYPVFQYEWLIGRRDGIFGRENSPEDEQWRLLDGFPDAEAIGITTYPGLVFPDSDEIPPDYYGAIADHTDLPIVFTEMGWQSGVDLRVMREATSSRHGSSFDSMS